VTVNSSNDWIYFFKHSASVTRKGHLVLSFEHSAKNTTYPLSLLFILLKTLKQGHKMFLYKFD